jgi:hypothetical protein
MLFNFKLDPSLQFLLITKFNNLDRFDNDIMEILIILLPGENIFIKIS